ncbi:hypothetical protein EG68_07731 [Paragonimus skrjabini miyazakii]|uniref:CH-like domain-containing protein n=1 Tax=Paragonimus skrjabini miyazakii TaxID=59628 RepID=A0A8S9YQC6_9TREM|nr:hypothetical protein EG68_07731 [Paragonimus skrjabini miyazakii]
MAGLTREVARWLLSLNLPHFNKKLQCYVANGILVAEILHCYYPNKVQLEYYVDGNSVHTRLCASLNLSLNSNLVDAAIHGKFGSINALLTELYETLTRKKRVSKEGSAQDFTDYSYQIRLPFYARPTAARTIKNNIKSSELIEKPDMLNREKVVRKELYIMKKCQSQILIIRHRKLREKERVDCPERFDLKHSLHNICERKIKNSKRTSPKGITRYPDATVASFKSSGSLMAWYGGVSGLENGPVKAVVVGHPGSEKHHEGILLYPAQHADFQ